MSAKSIGAVWIAVALVVGVVIGAGGLYAASSLMAPPPKQSLLDTIKSRGTLIVGTSADWPPFEYIDAKGNFAGIDMVIAERIAREIGVKLEIRDMKFGALIQALKAGQIDLILADLHHTAEREKEIDFSKGYYVAYDGAVVVLKGKASMITSEASLVGKNIGVQQGTIQEEWAKEKLGGKANIVSYDRVYPEMVMTLKRGDLDAIIVGDIIGSVLASRDPDLAVVLKIGSLSGAAIGIPQGEEELKFIVNKVIEDLISTGEMNKIFEEEINKWLEQ
ncbi:MAG: ABC transporter substrate-binding protein [Nitrososphaerota archaeon]|nr:ABC transporter substrate-binding protein [Candidatus Calditenuaceae archaeon]MDW8073570.1 ABC transporter substrate-binding protein [Nitrososphaerota archaeon]